MIEEKEEIWKDIPGFPNYKVSNLGRVKSLNYHNTGKEKIRKTFKDYNGYLKLDLWKKCKQKTVSVHRLVAESFIPNPNNFPEVNHKDECKTNNNVNNLEWCTREHNVNFGTRTKRSSKSNTNNPKRSKKVKCLETGLIFPSTNEVQRQLGFSQQNISACCRGKLKSCYGYHWQYV